MAAASITWSGFFWRWVLALTVVLGAFNPTDYSYFSWVMNVEGGLPLKALVGVVLLIVIIVYLRATWFSIGPLGLILAAAFFAALIWVLVDFGLLTLGGGSVLTWIILIILSLILAIGMSFSLFRRRISGQVDVDDVET
jgi:hypothetical protein